MTQIYANSPTSFNCNALPANHPARRQGFTTADKLTEDTFAPTQAPGGNRFVLTGAIIGALVGTVGVAVAAYMLKDRAIGACKSLYTNYCPGFVKSGINAVKSWFGYGAEKAAQ